MKQTVYFLGKSYQVASGFNLYIDISAACNASCPFCIAPTIGREDGPGFFDGAKFALDLTESIIGTIQVVGGEPMISRRLPRLLEEIGKRDYRRTIVNTNGSFVSNEIVSAMKSARVTNINVSRHHYDELLNQEVMKFRPGLPNATLASGIKRIIDSGINLRMQCNLIKGYIDSVQKMLGYIDWCVGLGCKEISFSQIFPLNLFDYQVPIESGYAERVQIDLRQLVTEMDTCGKFSPVPVDQLRGQLIAMSMWGYSNWGGAPLYDPAPPKKEKEKKKKKQPSKKESGGKRRFWYGPNETYLSLKTLTGYDEGGLPKETAYNKQDDWELKDGVLAFAVLHSDGRVTASWDRRERLLFNPCALPQKVTLQKQHQPLFVVPNCAEVVATA